MEPSCEGCMFWKEISGYSGMCRRYPPTIPPKEIDDREEGYWSFPMTMADDWCGEFHKSERRGGHSGQG